jgi:hypothetical protein
LFVLVDFHIQTLHEPVVFAFHLFVTYALTFLAFSSLIVCLIRDPGPVVLNETRRDGGDNEEVGLTEALLASEDAFSGSGRWCRKCKVCATFNKSYAGNNQLTRPLNLSEPIIVPIVVVAFSKWVNFSCLISLRLRYSLLADHHCPWLGSKCIVS